jgi:HAD superfamily hydrolase (TIGR01509 family)
MPRYQATLFDCDGVLVDSEPITNAVLSEMLGELGWPVTPAECARIFTGRGVLEEQALIEARTGRALPAQWAARFRERRNAELERRLQPMPYAVEAVAQLHARYAGRIAVVSGAHRAKVELALRKCRLLEFFGPHVFSGQECERSKPHPDVYLAAAQSLGVDPHACVIVEDTVTGVMAGVAAGATVIGYSPSGSGHSPAAELLRCGAVQVITDLRELVALV